MEGARKATRLACVRSKRFGESCVCNTKVCACKYYVKVCMCVGVCGNNVCFGIRVCVCVE